jgi:hypothetical protein
MTFRWLGTFIDGLPPESRTKTAIRDDMDPFELADATAVPMRGWGPHGRMDERLMQLGERLDNILVAIARLGGSKAEPPAPWRRPGILGARELAELRAKISHPVIEQLEAERAEREARRQAEAAQQQ